MPSLRDCTGQELTWVRPRLLENKYELRLGNQGLASLTRRGFLKQISLAEAEGQQWRFKRRSGWKTNLAIYAGGNELPNEAPLASLQRRWNGQGELIFRDNHGYSWQSTRSGLWSRSWFWTGPDGSILSMKKKRVLEIAPEARMLPDLPLLVLFSFYLILVMEDDAAAAGA